jgi:hypothetical protein
MFDPRRPFTSREALAAGLTRKDLQSASFRRLLLGVYVDATVPATPALQAAAVLCLLPPTAWVSHATAARLLGVPLPALPDEHACVREAAQRLRRRGVHCHVGRKGARLVLVDGVRASAPAQVFVELGEQLTLVDLVIAGDWMVRQKLVSLDRLRAFCRSASGAGAAAARRAVGHVRERVDSPMETRLRMLIVLAGIPEPVVNREIPGVGGRGARRYDLSWPGVRVIVEYDGRHHVEVIEQWEADLERREAIDDDEWRILVFVARDIFRRPDRTLARIVTVLRKARLAGMPRALSDDWRPHFPVKADYVTGV